MDIAAADFAQHNIEVRGMLDQDARPEGISPRRLPAWTRVQLPQNLDVMSRMPSGVRIRCRTDATSVSLRCQTTNLVEKGGEPFPVNFNLETGGKLWLQPGPGGNVLTYDPLRPSSFSLDRGEEQHITFADLPAGDKDIELWLPHNAYVELRSLSFSDGATITPYNTSKRTWVHYGSSISHCMEAEEPAKTWPAVAARIGGLDLQSLGFGGQCHVDGFTARTIRDLAPDVISLKLGINVVNMDSMRERAFVPAVHNFLDTLREGLPDTRILVISPIWAPAAENNPGPTQRDDQNRSITVPGMESLREGCLTLTRIRMLLEALVGARNDPNLAYLSGLELFNEADHEDLPDDLHPNTAGYIRMGERFAAAAFAPGQFLAQ